MAQQSGNVESREGSLVGRDVSEVRSWVEHYLASCGLACSADRLMAVAGKVEGTAAGVTRSREGRILHLLTKTKLRKARRRILSGN